MTRLLLLLALGLAAPSAAADELRLDAKALVGRSVARDVRLSPDGAAVELAEGELVEDDGPAAGFSYKPNEERLSDRVWARKGLAIPDPRARTATLLVGPGGGPRIRVNGKAVEPKPAGKVGGYWEAYTIPPVVLKPGANEVVLHGSGRVWIARAEDYAAGGSVERSVHPNRSARSADGGATWERDRLGPSGDVDGEYCVRLFLDRFRPAGSLVLPVLDAGNLAGAAVAPRLAAVGPVRVAVDADVGSAGRVAVRVRTGTTPVPDHKTWSGWGPLGEGEAVRSPKGRYLQAAADLTTTDPFHTPRLKRVTVTADPRKSDDWTANLKVTEVHNEEIVRSSIPFAYEPFDHPRLKELRDQYKLDEVAAGAKTEFELIERLARWSARRWDCGHLKEGYPPWDALEILRPHRDGTPVGGFCQQSNVVFLQACESFGIPGRAVSIGPGDHGGRIKGGHEVVEVWSNQFRKWVYVDGDMAWYAVDAASGVPLSLWELRRRQLRALAGKSFEPIRVVELAEGRRKWAGLTDWPPFLELRLIPRSNFLEQPAPLPLNQGMRGWFWTGHYAWTDAAYPVSQLYGNRVTNRRDWEWSLNQAHLTLEATAMPGDLRVHLDTETPGFDTFLATLDGKPARLVASGFVWKLHAGKNTLEVQPRNVAGREGIPSRVVILMP